MLTVDANDVPPESYWNQKGPTLRPSSLRLGIPVTENSYSEVSLYEESRDKYEPYLQPTDTIFPSTMLAYDETQAAEVSTTEAPFNE